MEAGDHVKFGTVEVIFEYVPRPLEIETDDADEIRPAETTEIDGFEFKKRVSEDDAPTSSPAISMPDETLRLESEKNTHNDGETHEPVVIAETAVEHTEDDVKAEPTEEI